MCYIRILILFYVVYVLNEIKYMNVCLRISWIDTVVNTGNIHDIIVLISFFFFGTVTTKWGRNLYLNDMMYNCIMCNMVYCADFDQW